MNEFSYLIGICLSILKIQLSIFGFQISLFNLFSFSTLVFLLVYVFRKLMG